MFEIMNHNTRSSKPNTFKMFDDLEILLKDGSGLVFTSEDRKIPGEHNDPEVLDEEKNKDFETTKEKDPNNVDPRGSEPPSKYAPGTKR